MANDCINLKKNVKIASWMPGSSKKKSKIQDVLDSILKICYPYMSQGFGWTDFQTDLTSDDATIDVKLHPEYIPEGAEDKVAITVGKAAGRKSALISVWKEGSHVHIDQINCWVSSPSMKIGSASEIPVTILMKMTRLVISSTEVGGGWLGQYEIAGERNGAPYYRQTGDDEDPHY